MVKEQWIYCPICNNKTRIKILEKTTAKDLPVFCPKCKIQSILDIEPDFKIKVKTDIV